MSDDKIITPPVRASYPKLFEPEINKQGKKVYGCALLIEDTPEGHAFLAKAEKLAEECGRQKFGKRFDEVLGFARQHGGPKWAIRKDLINKYKDAKPAIIGVINARSYDTPPGVVSIYAGPDGKPAKITDPAMVYPGCYIKASIRPYATDMSENKAVSFALGNVQVLTNMGGSRLDNRTAAEDEFTADPNASADLADL